MWTARYCLCWREGRNPYSGHCLIEPCIQEYPRITKHEYYLLAHTQPGLAPVSWNSSAVRRLEVHCPIPNIVRLIFPRDLVCTDSFLRALIEEWISNFWQHPKLCSMKVAAEFDRPLSKLPHWQCHAGARLPGEDQALICPRALQRA